MSRLIKYHPKDITSFVHELQHNNVAAVYGCRFSNDKVKAHRSHVLGKQIINKFNKILYKVQLADRETGYKLMQASVLRSLGIKSREFEVEVTFIRRRHPRHELAINPSHNLRE